MQIAFFDSGIGGLTVLHEAMQQLPNEDFIYFGDCLNAPYGTKSQEEIQKLTKIAFEKLSQHNLKAAVLACNTATSAAIEELRQIYPFPIIGMEPSVKPAISDKKRAVICATDLTLQGGKLKKLIQTLEGENQVQYLSLQQLVAFAEKNQFDTPEAKSYLQEKLTTIDWQKFDSLVLGCTHFIYFKSQIQKIIPSHIQIFDGIHGTITQLKNKIQPAQNSNQPKVTYHLSGFTDQEANEIATKYLTYLNQHA